MSPYLVCAGCLKALPNPEDWPSESFRAVCSECGPFLRPGLYPGVAAEFWRNVGEKLAEAQRYLPPGAELRLFVHPVAVHWLYKEGKKEDLPRPTRDSTEPLWRGALFLRDDRLAPQEWWLGFRWR